MAGKNLLAGSMMLLVLAVFLGACQQGAATRTTARMPADEWQIVVIGDSSLWGLGEALASQIETDMGVRVALEDFALPSLSAGSVRAVLESGESSNFRLEKLPAAVKEAEMVVMFTNPVDSVDPAKPLELAGCFGCNAPQACEPEAFAQYQADLTAIWTNILALRAGQPTILRATDLYNPMVSQWQECETFAVCNACWQNMSTAARQAAEAVGVPFLSRYQAFNGVEHDEDPRQMGYIQSDGEHPTELASQFTSGLLAEMGYEPIPVP